MPSAFRRLLAQFALVTFLAATFGADSPELAVAVEGNITKPQTWTAAQLKADFAKDIKTIKYTLKTENHTATAVPLIDLVNAGEPKIDPKIKNHQMHFVVVIEGKDGYLGIFSLADLLPEIGNREAWITLDLDGKPLSDRDAPANLVIPSDLKPERWVHGIKTIRIIDMGTLPKN